jgi:hypothetical protein
MSMLQSSLWRHLIKLELCIEDKAWGSTNLMISGMYIIGSSISLQSSEGEVYVLVMIVKDAIVLFGDI